VHSTGVGLELTVRVVVRVRGTVRVTVRGAERAVERFGRVLVRAVPVGAACVALGCAGGRFRSAVPVAVAVTVEVVASVTVTTVPLGRAGGGESPASDVPATAAATVSTASSATRCHRFT
jgi:hypothetical protein